MNELIYKGLYTAIITPFNQDGNLDLQSFSNLVELQVKAKVNGIVVCGTTGESPTVTEGEMVNLIETAKKTAGDKLQVIAGTGSNNTSHVIKRSLLAQKHGADGLLIAAPYYNKPTQQGLAAHYLAIADAVDLPQIIYNVPGRTAVNILPATQIQLARHPNIVAVKEASGDINQIMDVISLIPEDFSVLAGDDGISLPTIAAGGHGVISVVSNQAPALMNSMIQFALDDKYTKAREVFYRLLPLMKANFWDSNPMAVKASLSYMGLIHNAVRLPLVPLSNYHDEPLKKILKDLELI